MSSLAFTRRLSFDALRVIAIVWAILWVAVQVWQFHDGNAGLDGQQKGSLHSSFVLEALWRLLLLELGIRIAEAWTARRAAA